MRQPPDNEIGRPRQDGPLTSTTASIPPSALEVLDYGHAQFVAGSDHGRSQGQLDASVDLARQWLLDLSRDDEYIATGMARARHGSGWESLIRAQSRGEDW